MKLFYRVKKILKSTSGVALVTVLGIMAVISILATGMYYFSTNELNFAGMDANRATAEYLAKAGVEISAQSFYKVASNYNLTQPENPVTGTVYLHSYTDDTGATQYQYNKEENKIVLDGQEIENPNIGVANVTISQQERDLTDPSANGGGGATHTYKVWVYKSKATVKNASKTVTGITLPVTDMVNEGFVGADGSLLEKNDLGSIPGAASLLNAIRALLGIDTSVKMTGGNVPGIITTPESLESIHLPNNNDFLDRSTPTFFLWQSGQGIFINKRLDLVTSGIARSTNALALCAPNIVLGGEVRTYYFSSGRQNSLIFIPVEGMDCFAYFKSPVYMYRSALFNSRTKVIEAGTAYQVKGTVDLNEYARNPAKYQDIFVKVEKAAPSESSAMELIWE